MGRSASLLTRTSQLAVLQINRLGERTRAVHGTWPPSTYRFTMTVKILVMCIAVLFAHATVGSSGQGRRSSAGAAAFSFAGVAYFHRFTKNDQHEFTPAGQEDLNAWADMVTVHVYRDATNGEALAATANAVLENYKANQAQILKTSSVPRSEA